MGQQFIEEKSKKLLTTATNRISFLYIEKAKIEQSEYSVQIRQGNKVAEIPITTISCLILGPGTTITHRAITNIAHAGCSVCWMGSEQAVFYAFGIPTTNKSKNILKQCHFHESKTLHTQIIHEMYNYRYSDQKIKSLSLNDLKGFEGLKMKECYAFYSKKYAIPWTGRHYGADFEQTDLVNQYITALNQVLYAVTTAVIQILGFSPSIGFIHTGNINSFVFDIADLYKEEITIPLAFKLTSNEKYFNRHQMLTDYRKVITENRLISRMVQFLTTLFNNDNSELIDTQLDIWNANSYINEI